MSKDRVLVVDDDVSASHYVSDLLSSRGYEVDCLDSGERVIPHLLAPNHPSLVLLDLLMPTFGGMEVLEQMERLDSRIPVIVLSAVGRVNTVVKAMRLGAKNFLLKPFEDQELLQAIQGALGAAVHNSNGHHAAPGAWDASGTYDLVSANRQVLRVKEIARLVANTDVPVLISGESGVGKEVVARYIHSCSDRRLAPLVKVNCAALPGDLLESELFGYERGAFTGAMREKPGKFELADKGSLLLDEIGEMSPQLQAKLLHVLQDGEFTRLGGTSLVRVDVRILAATNKRLEAAVAKGEFREDLFFRLNVIRIEVPPLRERPEDLALLCRHLLEKYALKYGQSVHELPPQMMEAFYHYSWPGNVRQLENVIKRFLILRDPDLVLADLKPPEGAAPAPAPGNLSLRELSSMAAEQTEKEVILHTLEETNWNRKEAARRLDICYKSLLKKLRRWGIPGRSKALAGSGAA